MYVLHLKGSNAPTRKDNITNFKKLAREFELIRYYIVTKENLGIIQRYVDIRYNWTCVLVKQL